MKFDILRRADFEAGLVGKDAPRPVAGAVFNSEENRWELEVADLNQLVKLIQEYKGPVLLYAACPDCEDLCVISLEDDFDDDDDLLVRRETSYDLS